MDIDQVRCFAAAARADTFAQAARDLHVSQSSLTRGIQRVERELGGALFDRAGRNVTLNATGRAALPFAERIVEDARLMAQVVADSVRRRRTLGIISCAPAPIWVFVPQIAARFPDISVTTRTDPDEPAIIAGLQREEFDLAILREKPSLPGISSLHLLDEALLVGLPAGHRLAGRSKLAFGDVDGEAFLLHSDIGFWESLVRERMPRSTFVTRDDYVLVENMIRASALPRFTTNVSSTFRREEPGRISIPLVDPQARVRYYLAWLSSRGRELSDWIEVASRL